jgi:hypothetical protein
MSCHAYGSIAEVAYGSNLLAVPRGIPLAHSCKTNGLTKGHMHRNTAYVPAVEPRRLYVIPYPAL